MVRVRIGVVRDEEHIRPLLANDRRQAVPRLQGVLDLAVLEAQVRAGNTHDLAGPCPLLLAQLRRAIGRRLAVGHVQDVDMMALPGQLHERPAHPQLRVVRVRRNAQKSLLRRQDPVHRHGRILPPAPRLARSARPGLREAARGCRLLWWPADFSCILVRGSRH